MDRLSSRPFSICVRLAVAKTHHICGRSVDAFTTNHPQTGSASALVRNLLNIGDGECRIARGCEDLLVDFPQLVGMLEEDDLRPSVFEVKLL